MHVCLHNRICLFPQSSLFRQCFSTSAYVLNYYKILDVSQNATNEEIKKAYLQKCKDYHPDRNKGSKEMQSKFVEAKNAFTILSDLNKRRDYDAKLNNFSYSSYKSNQWHNQTRAEYGNPYQYNHMKNNYWPGYDKASINERWQKNGQNRNSMPTQQHKILAYGLVFIIVFNYIISIVLMKRSKKSQVYRNSNLNQNSSFR